MKTLEKIASMNANNIERKQMEELLGGQQSQPCCITLDTITCTPNGNSNDGKDEVQGECASVNVQNYDAYK